jgi:hypothetical protein
VWGGINSKGNMMAESKFTPGPLTATQNETVKGLWDVRSDRDFLGVAFDESAQANAELWADAPRMLELLRNLLAYAEIPQSWDGIDEAEQAFTQAYELLEKHGG